MAVLGELYARGPVARALLAVTVAQDVAVMLLFALVLAAAKPLASGGALDVAGRGTPPGGFLGSGAGGGAPGGAGGGFPRVGGPGGRAVLPAGGGPWRGGGGGP